MGDFIDITTVPQQEEIYYKLTSGSLRFQVKGLSSAGIGFATTPYGNCNLWFILGRDGCISVTTNRRLDFRVPTPEDSILSAHEYKEFWIQWHDNIISLGRDYIEDPLITFDHQTMDIKYVTFSCYDGGYSLQWRFEMPPLCEQLRIKPVDNGTPLWVQADSQLPDGALIGGYEREFLYIVRAKHQGSLTPGKFVPSDGLGYISWGGESHETNEFEVLCGYDCKWLPCSDGRVPAGAVVGGYSENSSHEPLYVGRAICGGHLIPGKVQTSHAVCYVAYKEKECAVKHYEVLVVPHKNAQCANFLCTYNYSMPISSLSDRY